MSKIKFMTVEELHNICKSMIDEGKGEYQIYLLTGGYYDSHAESYNDISDNNKTLTLSTPS